jgi:hypothetical protein
MLFNGHYSSGFIHLKENSFSGHTFEDKSDTVSSLNRWKVKLSKKKLQWVYGRLLRKHGKLESELDSEQEVTLRELKRSFKSRDKETSRFLAQNLSVLANLIKIRELLKLDIFDVWIFFPSMFCFRGRYYYLTPTSITFFKEFRFCLYLGDYERPLEKQIMFHYLCPIAEKVIDQYLDYVDSCIEFENFKNQPLVIKRAIVMLFISLAEPFKAELGAKVHISQFLIKALDIIKNRDEEKYFSLIDFFD